MTTALPRAPCCHCPTPAATPPSLALIGRGAAGGGARSAPAPVFCRASRALSAAVLKPSPRAPCGAACPSSGGAVRDRGPWRGHGGTDHFGRSGSRSWAGLAPALALSALGPEGGAGAAQRRAHPPRWWAGESELRDFWKSCFHRPKEMGVKQTTEQMSAFFPLRGLGTGHGHHQPAV